MHPLHHKTDQVRHYIETTDRLLDAVPHLSPRQATFFLLHFDSCFIRATGREPTDTQRMLIAAALRRVVQANA